MSPVINKVTARAMGFLPTYYDIGRGKTVAIVHDNPKKAIADGIAEAARNLGASVLSHNIGEARFSGQSYDTLAQWAGSVDCDLFVNVLDNPAEEVKFRIALTDLQGGRQIPTMHSPGIIESMFDLELDFPRMLDDATRIKALLKGAHFVHIKSAAGTDIIIGVEGREFGDDIAPLKRNSGPDEEYVQNYPKGEVWNAPLETGATGRLLVDGPISTICYTPDNPLLVDFQAGKIHTFSFRAMTTEVKSFYDKIAAVLAQDAWASVIGELGIGLIPLSDFIGNMLVDEKKAGTVHVAVGNNKGFGKRFGGQNPSAGHHDLLVKAPTVQVIYDGGRPPIILMADGHLNLNQ